MDKEILTRLISTMSELDIIEIYKQKKINNSGFRANTFEDVAKNRKMLEINLLKPSNMKILQGYFTFLGSDKEVDFEAMTWDEVIEYCESNGYLKTLSYYYSNKKVDEFQKLLEIYQEKQIRDKEMSIIHAKNKSIENENLINESKNLKTIKKLESKILNFKKDFQIKEENYKEEIESLTTSLSAIKENYERSKLEINTLLKENQEFKQQYKKLSLENERLLESNKQLNEQQVLSKEKEELLIEKIKVLEQKLESCEVIQTENQSEKNYNEVRCTSYRIAVFGQSNEIFSNDIENIQFDFIDGEHINSFSLNENIYNELWILHYDLTLKEKRFIKLKGFESQGNLVIKEINNLKELNQVRNNLTKIRG